jgi:adenosylcobinamide-GDP ribazoletransferase
MKVRRWFLQIAGDFLAAVQFLTRVPVPAMPYRADTLSRAVKFFPIVGLLIGAAAALLHGLFAGHLPRPVAALFVVAFMVLLTGCFHEDGLADAADGLGGGWSREQILRIFKDSRIGSYGGAALSLALLARVILIASLPLPSVTGYLIAAHVLCRWSTLPLSFYLSPANEPGVDGTVAGQGARIARLTTAGTLLFGTLVSLGISILALHWHATSATVAAVAVTLVSGFYYHRKIGGVTGDCFGATNQLIEIAVLLTGVWIS